MQIIKAKVIVMNSFDYNNYTIEIESEVSSMLEIDDLRRQAQVLVDHAVKQKKQAKEHDIARQYLCNDLNRAKQELELAKERHGKPKPRSFVDEDKDNVDLQDFSFKIHELENQIIQLQFQIDNWKPFDYDELSKVAEAEGVFDE